VDWIEDGVFGWVASAVVPDTYIHIRPTNDRLHLLMTIIKQFVQVNNSWPTGRGGWVEWFGGAVGAFQ